jgi:hypothetical protein
MLLGVKCFCYYAFGIMYAHFALHACCLANDGPQCVGKEESTRTIFAVRPGPWENLPESKRFISGTSHDRRTVWRHGQVQHTVRVASQSCNLAHAWISPDNNLVERVSVGAHNFVAVL